MHRFNSAASVDDDIAMTTENYVNATAHGADQFLKALTAGDLELAADIWDTWKKTTRKFQRLSLDRDEPPTFDEEDDDDANETEEEFIDTDLEDDPLILHSAPLLSRVGAECSAAELTDWIQHKDAKEMFQTWQTSRPRSLVCAHRNNVDCLARGLTGVGTNRPLRRNVQILSLVHQSGEPHCTDGDLPFQWYEPELFFVPQELASKGRGESRNFVGVWPAEGTCTQETPCPSVFFLSGIGEHSEWAFDRSRPALEDFVTIQKWGYLRYAERDPVCYNKLGSYLVFPQLDRDENWLHDGADMMGLFVIPLFWQQAKLHPGKLDLDKISIMGYSEGAFGALQAAAHFPHVFTLAVAASVSTSKDFWNQVHFQTTPPEQTFLVRSLKKNPQRQFALRSVIVALGEYDNTGSQPYNLREILTWMDLAGVMQQAALEFRYYAGLYHKEVWDRLFNRWDRFHEVFWLGNYSAIFRTSEL